MLRTELVVYSARNEQLIKPIFDRYTPETGQAIRFVTDDAGPLIERLAAEGANSPADILMTVDAGELWHAADRGLLQSVRLAGSGQPTFRTTCVIRRVAGSACPCARARSSTAPSG